MKYFYFYLLLISQSVLASAIQYKADILQRLPNGELKNTTRFLHTNKDIEFALRFSQGLEKPINNERITKLYRCVDLKCESVHGKYNGRSPY